MDNKKKRNTNTLQHNCMNFLVENKDLLEALKNQIKEKDELLRKSDNLKEHLILQRDLQNFEVLILLIYNDFLCHALNFLQAKIYYQQLNALKLLNVVIYESYKKIYGFGADRRKTFWTKRLKNYIYTQSSSYKADYERITDLLSKFETTIEQEEIGKDRHLFIHYDNDPVKVYDACLSLETEKEFKKVKDFLDIIEGVQGLMVKITNKIIEL